MTKAKHSLNAFKALRTSGGANELKWRRVGSPRGRLRLRPLQVHAAAEHYPGRDGPGVGRGRGKRCHSDFRYAKSALAVLGIPRMQLKHRRGWPHARQKEKAQGRGTTLPVRPLNLRVHLKLHAKASDGVSCERVSTRIRIGSPKLL